MKNLCVFGYDKGGVCVGKISNVDTLSKEEFGVERKKLEEKGAVKFEKEKKKPKK